jgi:hypothetical protein
MSLRRRSLIGGTLAAGLLLMLLGARLWLAGAGPLRGRTHHDFGDVVIRDRETVLSHAFELRNTRSVPVEITDVRSSCGCTRATPSRRAIPPGESVIIDTTLSLTVSSRKSAVIWLTLGEHGMMRLQLEAVGRREPRLSAVQDRLDLVPGISNTLVVFLEVHDGDAPPPDPSIECPPGVTASFSTWEVAQRRVAGLLIPWRWRGGIEFGVSETSPPPGEGLAVIRCGGESLTVPLGCAAGPASAAGAVREPVSESDSEAIPAQAAPE